MESRKHHHAHLTNNIITYIKIKRMVKRWIKKAKNSIYRKRVLSEWIDTEKKYLTDLEIIVKRIQEPMLKKGIVQEQDKLILFSNLDVIMRLSENMLDDLQLLKKQWNASTIKISKDIIKYHAYFKVYKQYCTKYFKANNIIKQLKSKNKLTEIEKLLPMDIQSYLIKPVQRPPKYILLLTDYQKHMPNNHPDYQDIGIAIQKYNEVSAINNQAIEKQLKSQKMFLLSKLYTNLLTNTREFRRESEGYRSDHNVKIYVFNDLVMITKYTQTSEQLDKLLFLDQFSFVVLKYDTKHYRNRIYICGKTDSFHIGFFVPKKQQQVYLEISKAIRDLYTKQTEKRLLLESHYQKSKPQQKVRVTLATLKSEFCEPHLKITVETVEKRPISLTSNETFFVITYSLPHPYMLSFVSYIQFNKIQELWKFLHKTYKNISFPELQQRKQTKFFQVAVLNEQTQYKQMHIQQFLNYALRNPQVLSKRNIYENLNIQKELWNFATTQNKIHCICHLCYSNIPCTIESFVQERNAYLTQSVPLEKEMFCIKKYMKDIQKLSHLPASDFNTYEKLLVWMWIHEQRIDYSRLFRNIKSSHIKVYLSSVEDEYFKVRINQDTTVAEIIDQMCSKLRIPYMNDYGLIFEFSGIQRVLDHDQNIFYLIRHLNFEENNQRESGYFSRFKESVEGKKSYLYFRKYLFFAQNLELQSCLKDNVRLELIVKQVLKDIKQEKIRLTEVELQKIVAIYSRFINPTQPISIKQLANNDKIKQIMPGSKISLLSNKKWVEGVLNFNLNNHKSFIQGNNPSHILHSVYQSIYMQVQQKLIFSSMTFNVTNHDPSALQGAQYVTLAINYIEIIFMRTSDRKYLKRISLDQLSYGVTYKSIYIYTDDYKYRFDGRMLYGLAQMIEKYKLYNRFENARKLNK